MLLELGFREVHTQVNTLSLPSPRPIMLLRSPCRFSGIFVQYRGLTTPTRALYLGLSEEGCGTLLVLLELGFREARGFINWF